MNSLIIHPVECVAPGRAVLTGPRARHAYEQHELRTGQTVKVALLGGLRGKVTVLSADPDKMELELDCAEPPLPRENVTVLVAVSRPQTVKKVINIGATIGVSALHFLRTDNVVKSYLQSKSLLSENIQEEIVKGLEQSGDSIPPVVRIHHDFAAFVHSTLPEILQGSPDALRLIADTSTGGVPGLEACRLRSATQEVCLAIGPESGWSLRELVDFERLGFERVSLGPRILRVETALTAMISQVALLRRLRP